MKFETLKQPLRIAPLYPVCKNYQIIINEDTLKEYIEWLPDLGPSELYYGCLFARKKYCTSIPWPGSDKSQLKRFTARKENLLHKIKQLECPVGSYEMKGVAIPQDALALYLHVNPRNMWKATIKSISALAKVIECDGRTSNPHQEVMSEIQKSKGNVKYLIFDLDTKDQDVLQQCIDIVEGNVEKIMETRGGFHIFIPKDKVKSITNKKWYTDLSAITDVTGDNMSPVPGCIQGGFVPGFIK